MRVGQCHRRLDAGRSRSCVRGPGPQAWPRRRARRLRAARARAPSIHPASACQRSTVCCSSLRSGRAPCQPELAQRREQAWRPLGRRCAAGPDERRQRLAQARRERGRGGSPVARSRNAASSSAPEFQLPSLAQARLRWRRRPSRRRHRGTACAATAPLRRIAGCPPAAADVSSACAMSGNSASG